MKIGIVGAGTVGASCAYALVMRGVGREIVLVDRNVKRAQAEADDIFHAVPFAHPLRVRAGDFPDLYGARVVIIAAGVGQKPGESRLALLRRNAAVFGEIVPQIVSVVPRAVIIVVSNPVDLMTHLTARCAGALGVSANRILGSGTALDTARFRVLLGERLGVDPHHVHAYVIGEHGDSEVLTWSLVSVGGIPLAEFFRARAGALPGGDRAFQDGSLREEIDGGVKGAAYSIIEGKGATHYGIGSAVSYMVNVILRDQRSVLTVSTPVAEVEGVGEVSLSLPQLIGGEGVLATLLPALSDDEHVALQASARVVRLALEEFDASGGSQS